MSTFVKQGELFVCHSSQAFTRSFHLQLFCTNSVGDGGERGGRGEGRGVCSISELSTCANMSNKF